MQDFQRFHVFGFDKHVLRGVEIHAFAFAGNQGIECRRLQGAVGGGFARPIEMIAFVVGAKIVFAENQFEFFPVDLVFAKHFWKQRF
ncbi:MULTISPECIES: hypothetical protein [unclassified Neisseria]|uniref:hypothetical protein n=1 Tax=unclassified Neisseria TaxID=2623750 RepID=UPI001D16865B|nr:MULTISPECIES: hypothetical protein [unclassified Neisseria]